MVDDQFARVFLILDEICIDLSIIEEFAPGIPMTRRDDMDLVCHSGICNQNHCAQQARCCSTGFIFSNILMLRVTARTLLLLYLVVDVIINPVNLRSGKLTRCSEIQCSVLGQVSWWRNYSMKQPEIQLSFSFMILGV